MLKPCDLIQPKRSHRVARHSPVSTRGEADGAYFRAVGQATALELLLEEAAEEGMEPFLEGGIVVGFPECPLRQEVDLCGGGTEAQEVIEEEIVQLVGVYHILRLLLDISMLVGGNQFRADRSVYYI